MSFTAIISADAKGFEQAIQQAQKQINLLEKNVSQKLASVGDKFTDIGKKASVFTAAFSVAAGKAYTMAADFQDALGATDQIFKQSSAIVKEWAKNLTSDYGIAKGEALEYSNLMGSMLINIGKLTDEQAAKQSQKLIQLAGDLTAMYGGTTQDAVRALTAALKGNNTMLDNYGMAVNDALVKQKALELGLSSGTEELSLQARQAATLALIWEQTGAAQGQAAREADGASGSMRALKTEISNLSTEIGEILIPIITPLVNKIRDIISELRNMSPEMQKTIVVIAGLAAAIGPLMLGLGSLLKIVPLIVTAFTAMTGPVGIAIAATTVAVTALTIGIVDLINKQKEAKTAADALATINETVTNKISREIAELNILVRIARDETKSKDERRKAIEDINKISPEYLGNINLETINTNAAKTAIDNYTTSLKEKARQQAIAEKVAKLEAKRIDLETEIIKRQEKVRSFNLNTLIGRTKLIKETEKIVDYKTQIKSIDKQISLYESLNNVTTSTTKTTGKQTEVIGENITKINELTDVTNKLSTTQKELFKDGSDINKLINNISNEISILTKRLEGLRSGEIISKNVYKDITETKKKINELSTALENLKGPEKIEFIEGTIKQGELPTLDVKPIEIPAIDTTKFETSLSNMITITFDYGQLLEQGIGDMISSIGAAFATGDWDNLGKELISAVGSLAQQFGSLLMGMGVAALNLKTTLITQPWLAIAAGAALVALGAAAQAAASKMINKATSGGGYTGGTSSYQQTQPAYAPSEYRGAYKEDYTVTFIQKGSDLVGVLDMAEEKRNRT